MSMRQILVTLAAVILCGWNVSTFAQCSGHVVLNDYERSSFLSAAYGKRAEIAVQILAADGCSGVMLGSLRGLGAHVRFFDAKVGYALAMLPREKVLEVLDLSGVSSALAAASDGDYSLDYQTPTSGVPPTETKTVPPIAVPLPHVAIDPPKNGPYFAAAEAGLSELWRQHPEADGRGVRIAVLDRGLDLLHPALREGKDGNGHIVPKVADVISVTTPKEDAGWVQFGDPIQTIKGTFVAAGRTWTAPHDGDFRFGIFNRELHLGEWYRGIGEEENAHLKSVPLSVGVLWDERNNRVWVDTDGDGSFRNQRALGDYAETHDVDYFGRKEGENDNRIPFGVKFDRSSHAAYLSIADSPHGGMVAGPLAANRLTGGLFEGAAPSAQLIDARLPSANPTLALLLSAFARSDVDVINKSGVLAVPSDDGRNDFQRHVFDRAMAVYDKPIACFCGGSNTLYVLDYQSPEMLRRNRQLPPPYREAINGGVWFTTDGQVNTVLAPSASLVTQSRYMPFAVPWEDGRTHITKDALASPAPAGYAIGANPSPTIPVVSGILADLISEARRQHVRYDAARLTQAVFTGTRTLDGFSAAEQGFGLVNAAGAWNQLVKMSTADDPKNPVLTSFAVARMEDGRLKKVNGFHADLPQPGETLHGDVWITRRGGYSGGREYTLSMRANDGTYMLLDQKVTLVRDQAVRVRFEAKVTSGLHVAFLQLKDALAGVVMQEVPLSTRAPSVLETIAPGVEKYQKTIPPLRGDEPLVRLGEDVQAARFVMRIPYEGSSFISARSIPEYTYGVVGDRFVSTERPSGEPVDAMHHVGPMQEFESLIANTKPGIQYVYWENRGRPEYATPYDDPAPDVPITGIVTVTKYTVAFSKGDGQSVRATNKLADINGRVEFYDAKLTSSELTGKGAHAMATLQHTLPPHLSEWRVFVAPTSVDHPTTDAFLLDCTRKEGCSVAAQKPVTAKGAIFVTDDPKEGDWRIVIRARQGAAHPTSYQIREARLVPSSAAAQSGVAGYVSGAAWSVSVPPQQSDAQYVAFRIAGSPDNDAQKNGLRIAMTPLTAGSF